MKNMSYPRLLAYFAILAYLLWQVSNSFESG